MKIIKFLLLIGISISTAMALSPGDKAPNFSLTNQDAKTINLKDFKGKYVILEWFNDGCPFVRKHYDSNNMQNTQKMVFDKIGKDKIAWLSINSSAKGKQGHIANANAAKAMLKSEKSMATHMLLDTNGDVGRKYEAKTTPQIFIIKPDGTIGYNGAIDSIRSADSDDIKDADNYVTLAINAIKANKKIKPSKTSPYGCSVKY